MSCLFEMGQNQLPARKTLCFAYLSFKIKNHKSKNPGRVIINSSNLKRLKTVAQIFHTVSGVKAESFLNMHLVVWTGPH